MMLSRPLRIAAPVRFVPNGNAVRRENLNSGSSTSAFSVKGNAYRMLQNRFLTKVRGHFNTAGLTYNVLVFSMKNDTQAGAIIEILLNGAAFTTTTGYQEITLPNPIFLNQFTRYGVAFRNPSGGAVSMKFQIGDTPIDYPELRTSLMLRSNETPAVGVDLTDTTQGNLWLVDITTEEALAIV